LIEGSGPTVLKVRGLGEMWTFHRRITSNGEPLPTRFVSKDEPKAIIPPEVIATAGTYVVTLNAKENRLPNPIGPIWW
jgi:hypothetical protein